MATIHRPRLHDNLKLRELIRINNIKRLNPEIVKENGSIASFKEQLFDLMGGQYNLNYPMIIETNSIPLSYISSMDCNRPLIMPPNTAIKILTKHEISSTVLGNIGSLIENSVLAFDSMTRAENKVVVINELDTIGNQIIMALRLDLTADEISINQIASVYGKHNFQRFIENTYDSDLVFYKNEKTKQFITDTRLQLPNPLINALQEDSIKEFRKSQILEMQNFCHTESMIDVQQKMDSAAEQEIHQEERGMDIDEDIEF